MSASQPPPHDRRSPEPAPQVSSEAENLLARARAEALAWTAPSLEQLQALANKTLPDEEAARVEAYLVLHPEYRSLLGVLQAPDPRLQVAYREKLAQLEQGTSWAASGTHGFYRAWNWLLGPFGRASLAAALLLLISLPFFRNPDVDVPEFGPNPLVQQGVRSGVSDSAEPVRLTTGQRLAEQDPVNMPAGQAYYYELAPGRLSRLEAPPSTALPGPDMRLLLYVRFDRPVSADELEAALTPLIEEVLSTRLAPAERRERLLRALSAHALEPRAITVSPVFVVVDP